MGAVGESYDPHVVVRYADGWPEGSEPIMGREAVMRQWEQQREPFDADTLELIEIIDLGDRVVTRFIWRAVGSGPDLNIEVTSVSTVRKGKTILVEAVGLSARAFGGAFILALVMSANLAMFLADPKTTVLWGMTAGALAGIGWVAAGLGIIALFENRSWTYILAIWLATTLWLLSRSALSRRLAVGSLEKPAGMRQSIMHYPVSR